MITNSTLDAQRPDAKSSYPHINFPMFLQLDLTEPLLYLITSMGGQSTLISSLPVPAKSSLRISHIPSVLLDGGDLSRYLVCVHLALCVWIPSVPPSGREGITGDLAREALASVTTAFNPIYAQ